MYRHNRGELSELARGQGLLCGGVEVECFADDLKAFTLTGQPILKPTDSIYGKTTKPYRKHQLAIPKTYVTKRGQMVLFTSSDDMVFGKSCQIHQRDATTQQTVHQLKTTNKLFSSAMGYNSSNGDGPDLTVRAGHFTNVYLNSLQKAAQTQRAALQAAEESVVEDIEGEGEKKGDGVDKAVVSSITCYAQVDGESEAPLVECDSGLGHSVSMSASGRLSAQSHASESMANGTVIHIPHGRDSQPEDTDVEHEHHTDQSGTRNTASALDALKMELDMSHVHKSNEQSTVKKKSGKKRRQTIGDRSQTEKSSKAKSKKRSSGDSTSTSRKSSKVKRKRSSKKDNSSTPLVGDTIDKSVEAVMDFTVDGENVCESTEKKLEVTAVQLTGKEKMSVDDREAVGRLSRAEQRRMEIERKRAEKKALELEKRRQEEEQMRLQALIDQKQHHRTETQHEDYTYTPPLETPDGEQEDVLDSDISAAHGNIVTVEQKSLRNRLTYAKLRENRLLLAYRGEKVEEKLSDDIDSAEGALRLAQEAKERREKLRLEQEERLRLLEQEKRQHEELAQRSKTLDEKATKIREERNKSMHQDLANQRIHQNVSKSFMFSYFRFVPPPKPKVEKKTRRARASKSQRPK